MPKAGFQTVWVQQQLKWAPIYRELRNRESFNQPEPPIATPRPARRRKPKV